MQLFLPWHYHQQKRKSNSTIWHNNNHKFLIMAKKELPYSVTKSELYSMYISDMPEYKIKRGINEILKEKPFYKDRDKVILHNEFMEFVNTYGLPKGYFITDAD